MAEELGMVEERRGDTRRLGLVYDLDDVVEDGAKLGCFGIWVP
jgi:hypothetical protein